jgi:FkbM family methyltransferase
MKKLRLILGLFGSAPVVGWPTLAWYLLSWLGFRLFRFQAGEDHVLLFHAFKVVVSARGQGGLVFLHEILAQGIYEIEPLYEDKSIRVIFDAGANCGFFALKKAVELPALRVFCFEPHPKTFQRLEQNITVNELEQQITAVHAAVGASSGECAINISEESSMSIVSSSSVQFLAAPKPVTVPMVSLDAFAEAHSVWPDFLKIDVEGFEVEVLKGATRCLKGARWVLLEYHSAKLKSQCADLLNESGFSAQVLENGLLLGRRLS